MFHSKQKAQKAQKDKKLVIFEIVKKLEIVKIANLHYSY